MIDGMKTVETVLYQATEMAFEYLTHEMGTLVHCNGWNCSNEFVDCVLEIVSGSSLKRTIVSRFQHWTKGRSILLFAVDLIDKVDVLAATYPPHYTQMPGLVTMTRIVLFESFDSLSIYH